MKKQFWFPLVLLLLVLVAGIQSAVLGAESMTITNYDGVFPRYVEFAWTTATDGDASGDATSFVLSGVPKAFVTYPSATAAPTDKYKLLLLNDNGHDILANGSASSSATLVEVVAGSAIAPFQNTTLEVQISAAGDTKSGIARLYY